MRSVLRSLLLWIAAIAIPAQGITAATMAHCGPGHAARMTASSAAPEQGPAHGGQSADEAQGIHAAHAPHVMDDFADPPQHEVASTDRNAASKCSACAASCCIGLGLLASIDSMSEPGAEASPPAAPSATARGFLTDGPERPPRSILA